VLGVAQSLGALVSPQGFQLSGHGVFLAVLLVRLLRSHGHRLGRQPKWMRLLWRRA
jgi:branched-chain amino acid transport system permease protein